MSARAPLCGSAIILDLDTDDEGRVRTVGLHVEAALHVGWSKEEVIEMLIQTAAHAGVAMAIDAIADCHDLLVDCTGASSDCC